MKKMVILFSLLLLVFASFSTTSASDVGFNESQTVTNELENTNQLYLNDNNTILKSDADTIYVSVDGNDSNTGTKDSPLKTLDVAITKNHESGGGKTIFLSNGNYTTSNLNISDNVNIIGESSDNVILDANSEGYIITSSATVNIVNLTFKNAFNAIVNDGKMVIETSSFINNIANIYGGAIDNNGNLVVKKSKFVNNTAKSNGGAIDNSATLIVNDCLFIDNSAANDAGAISSVNDNYNAIATITDSVFVNNKAVRNGGAIKAQKSQLIVTNSIFDNNVLEGYYEGSFGGAIYGWAAGVSLYNSTFTNNKILKNSMGGALYVHGGYNNIITFNASGLTLINNSADYGGACYFSNAEGNLSNSIILNNHGHNNEAIYGPAGALNTPINFNNNWWGNTQYDMSFDTDLIGGLTVPTQWLILNLEANTQNVTVGDNVAVTIDLTKTQKGTVVNLQNKIPVTFKSINGNLNVSSMDLINGKGVINYFATLSGNRSVIANVYSVSTNITFNISPIPNIIYVDTVNGNDSNAGIDWAHPVKTIKQALTLVTKDKNMIYLAQGTYEESGLVISNNVSIVGFGNVVIDGKNSNAIFNINESNLNVTFKNINFINGKSAKNGGAIDIENNGTDVRNGCVLVDNCTFKNNAAGVQFGYGGAIYNFGYNLTVNNSAFVNNSASFNGAVTSAGGNLVVSNSKFINNTASGAYGWGGAIRANSGTLTVEKSVFINNTASKASAVLVFSLVTKANINYCIFEGYNETVSLIESSAKTTVDANYNYFGTNDNPSKFLNGDINAIYWTILNISSSAKEIVDGETVALDIDFTKFSDGTNTYALKEQMPTLTVSLKPTIGSVNPDTVICENGIASVNYTALAKGNEVINLFAPENVGTFEFEVLDKESNIIYVSNSGNDSNNGTKDYPLKTLEAAIAKNHERGGGKTIYVFDGAYEAVNLTIKDNVNIIGQSRMVRINANYSTAFTIVDSNVVMANFTLQNGINGISNNAKLSIKNGVFSNNKVAILNNGDLVVSDSSVFSADKVSISNNGNAIVKKSTFTNGKDSCIVNAANLTVDASKFTGNTGGAVYSSAGKITISNSEFTNNKANSNGGVIYLENTVTSLNKNTMSNNDETNIYIKSGSIISALNAVFLNNSTLRLKDNETGILNVTICDDNANKITGGEIVFTLNGEILKSSNVINGLANVTFADIPEGTYLVSGNYSFGSNLTIKTGILEVYSLHWFIGDVGYGTLAEAVNAAKDGDIIGGLAGTYYPTAPVTILKNITIKPRGDAEVIFDGSKLRNNTMEVGTTTENINNFLRIPYQNYNVTLINLTFANALNQGFGGAIYNHGYLNVYNCIFTNNSALGDDYYAYPYGGGAIFNYNGHVIVRDSYFDANIAYMGGAIYSSADKESPASLDVNNSIFKKNRALTQDDAGGAINIAQYTEVLINNTQFISNKATTKSSAQYTTAGGTGGAIFIKTTIDSVIANSNFVNNTAYYWGGAIKSSGVFKLLNCNFTNNIAGAAGGALQGAIRYVDGCVFESNSIGYITMSEDYIRGGAVSSEGNSVINNSAFYNNVGVTGGAAYAGSGTTVFDNCIFANNTASLTGGVVSSHWATLTLTNSYALNNSAKNGGAVYIDQYNFDRKVYLANNSFVNNSARNGGAIYSNSETYTKAELDVVNSEFINNKASENGREIYISGKLNIGYNAFVYDTDNNKSLIYVDSDSLDIVSIENNWWSVNNPNWNVIFSEGMNASKVYATINGTLNESGKGQYDLLVNMYWNGTTSQVDIGNIPHRLVKLNATSGSFSVDEGKFDNGVFKSLFFTGDDKNYVIDVNVDNEVLTFDLAILKPTSVNVTINKGDNPIDNIISVVVSPDKVTGNVTIDIDGKKSVVNLTNGKTTVTISNLTLGEHTLVVTYNGDEYYDASNVTYKFNETFSPIVDLTVPDLEKYFGGLEKLEAILKDNLGNPIANGTIIFTINGRDTIKYTNENGSAFININLIPGVYNITAKFNGTNIYNPMAVNGTVVVKSTAIGHDIVKMFRNSTQYSALFLDGEGNPLVNTTVKFNINGVLYNRTTNDKGIASLNIQLLPEEYIITNYNPVTGEENSNKVVVKSLLVDNHDLTKYYLNESKYTLKVIGKDGNIAAYQEVIFNINGVFYKRVSDENGIVSLAINLRPGNYVVTVEYEGCRVSNNINVLPTLITKDLEMKYHDGSKFSAQTLDGQGNPLANQNIVFNVNGVFYYKTTNEKGIAELNINLNKGEYIITSMWNDYQVGNKITIV